MSQSPPTLTIAVDIGGTYVRMVLKNIVQKTTTEPQKMKTDGFPSLEVALHRFVLNQNVDPNDIADIRIARTSASNWKLDPSTILAIFPFAKLQEVNDFEANAMALTNVESDGLLHLAGKSVHPDKSKVRAVIGSGTGLGLAYMTPRGEIIATHGGHMLPAYTNQEQIDLSAELQKFKTNGSCPIYEDMLSGGGILNIYKILSGHGHLDSEYRDTHHLLAEGRNNPVVQQTLKIYHEVLGQFAHQAVAFGGSYGGLFLTGGITDRLMGHNLFDVETFLTGFYQKNVPTVFGDVQQTPVFWVKDEFISLKGLLGSV